MKILANCLKLLIGVHRAFRIVVEGACLPIGIEISIFVVLFVAGFCLVIEAFGGCFAFLLLFSVAFITFFVPIDTKGLKLVNGHENFGELGDFTQLLARCFFFLGLKLSFLVVDLFKLSVELRDLIVQLHYLRVLILFVGDRVVLHLTQLGLFLV